MAVGDSSAARRRSATAGFTYLGLLLAIALLGVSLLAASELWVRIAKRQRDAQLVWTGEQYRRAISSYYQSSPSGVKTYPQMLGELLEDPRFPAMRRHLRMLYPNPMTGQLDWELVRAAGGGIQGIRVPAAGPGDVAGRAFVADGNP